MKVQEELGKIYLQLTCRYRSTVISKNPSPGFVYCISMIFVCNVYMYFVSGANGGQKRVSYPLPVELQMAVTHHFVLGIEPEQQVLLTLHGQL